jgi:hypothetical protein
MDPEFGNEQGGDAGGWDGKDEGGANNDGGAHVGDEDDFDDLEEMIQAIGSEILLKSPKGLENLERVQKASKETMYGVEKGCSTHWTVVRFVLELLIETILHSTKGMPQIRRVIDEQVHAITQSQSNNRVIHEYQSTNRRFTIIIIIATQGGTCSHTASETACQR